MSFNYKVNNEEFIDKWVVSELAIKRYIGEKLAFVRDDSLVGSDWSKIIYPIRKEYLAEPKNYTHRYETKNIDKLYYPFESNRVEFSAFWHECHEIEFYGKCDIIIEEDVKSPFKLSTCGNVGIYVNGKLEVEFAPFTRNQISSKEIELPLKKGKNEILVSCREFAERDTSNYYELKYLGEKELTVEVPLEIDAKKLEYINKFFKGAYLNRENFQKEEIEIIFPYKNEIEFDYSIKGQKNTDSFSTEKENKNIKTLDIGVKRVTVGTGSDFKVGFNRIGITADIGGIEVTRDFNVEIYPVESLDGTNLTIDERKTEAFKFMKEHGEENLHKIFALIEDGKLSSEGKKILMEQVDRINRRVDCADFRMPVLLWLFKENKELFTEEELLKIENTILDFRYWMDEPGNDVMWFFSENHALGFHTSELIAGELFKERTFSNCGMTGQDHIDKANGLLNTWFDNFERHGYGEWNSSVYIPIDLISLFALYQLTDDEVLKERTKNALDRSFTIFAENSYKGVISSSQGRAYESELRGKRITQGSALCWIAWGRGYLNQAVMAVSLFAMSSYEPPKHLEEIALYDGVEGRVYESVEGPEEVNLYMYKTKDYSMGSAIGYKDFELGHQEHLIQLNIGETPESQVWINHPGERIINGNGRPSYFAGNGCRPRIKQDRNKATLEFDILEVHDVDFTHAYTPLEHFEEYVMQDNWLFLKQLDGYIGLYVENGYELTSSGPLKNREIKSFGKKNKWIAKVGSKHEYGSFEGFVEEHIKESMTV